MQSNSIKILVNADYIRIKSNGVRTVETIRSWKQKWKKDVKENWKGRSPNEILQCEHEEKALIAWETTKM